jgi:hypothetical protein
VFFSRCMGDIYHSLQTRTRSLQLLLLLSTRIATPLTLPPNNTTTPAAQTPAHRALTPSRSLHHPQPVSCTTGAVVPTGHPSPSPFTPSVSLLQSYPRSQPNQAQRLPLQGIGEVGLLRGELLLGAAVPYTCRRLRQLQGSVYERRFRNGFS